MYIKYRSLTSSLTSEDYFFHIHPKEIVRKDHKSTGSCISLDAALTPREKLCSLEF